MYLSFCLYHFTGGLSFIEDFIGGNHVAAPEAKKVAPKTAPAKKAVKVKKSATAADTVLSLINRSKKGVDSAALTEKTGFDKKKIANLVFKLSKQGKIKSVSRGVYTKA